MKINIFSGARRLAALSAAAVALIVIGFSAFNEPYFSFNFTISAPNAAVVRSTGDCPDKAATDYFTTEMPDGKSIGVSLCLLPMAFGKEETQLVPYKVDSAGIIWGAEKYSSEIFAYEQQLEQQFHLSPADVEFAESESDRKYWQQWRDSLLYLAIGLAAYWILVAAIGWVVRGFMGIPLGQDSRVTELSKSEP